MSAADPGTYEAAPEDLFCSRRCVSAANNFSAFISHPRSAEPTPSLTDVRLAYYPPQFIDHRFGGRETCCANISEKDQSWGRLSMRSLMSKIETASTLAAYQLPADTEGESTVRGKAHGAERNQSTILIPLDPEVAALRPMRCGAKRPTRRRI